MVKNQKLFVLDQVDNQDQVSFVGAQLNLGVFVKEDVWVGICHREI